MTEINVTSSTQKIVVDPFSRAVVVIAAGPQGPPGPEGDPALSYAADHATAIEGTSETTLITPGGLQAKIDSLGPIIPFIGAYTTSAAPPATSVPAGHYYFDTDDDSPYFSNGTVWVGASAGAGGNPATGASAGIPGNFTPPGSDLPATYAQLSSWDPVPTPSTHWDVGQYVVLGDASHAFWDGDSWEVGDAPAIPLTVGLTATPSSTFEPWVGLTSATDISWRNSLNAELAVGATPSFAVPANGIINLVIEDGAAVEFLNFGFDNTQDAGDASLPASLNWPPTTLTGVTTSMTDIPNLKYFMAAETPLTGNLDISGHPHLEYIECFHAHVNTCDLTGCDALIRLCFETNDLTELDLTPVRTTLRDLRCADQGGVTPVDISCIGDLPLLGHYCVQGNAGGADVSLAQMPSVEEWWVWDKGMTTLPGGGLPVSPYLSSIFANNNPWTESVVDDLLIALADLAEANIDTGIANVNYQGIININSLVTASAAANGARALLLSRNWNLDEVIPTGDTTSDGVWPSNTKDGTADGWSRPGASYPVAVYNDRLSHAWSGYSRVMRATPDGSSIADPTYTVTADRESFKSTFWGIFCRADASGLNGARAMINGNSGAITGIGLSNGASTGNSTITNLFPAPAGWTNPGPHTMGLRLSGNQITVVLDGVDCYRATPAPAGGTWGGYYFGFCGTPSYVSRAWDGFTLTA